VTTSITLPPMEPAFALTLLNAARRDAEAFARAYQGNPEQRRFWTETSNRICKLIAALPAAGTDADALDELLG
jgi:hypothetical protein